MKIKIGTIIIEVPPIRDKEYSICKNGHFGIRHEKCLECYGYPKKMRNPL